MCQEELIQYYKVNPKRIEVLYNSVDHRVFNTLHARKHRKEIRQQLHCSPNQVLMLFVGKGFGRKNLDTVLQTAKQLGPDKEKCILELVDPKSTEEGNPYETKSHP